MNKLVELTYNDKQKNEIIIENFVKMLYNRKLLDDNLNNLIKLAISKFSNNETFISNNDDLYFLKIIPYKINTIKKSEDIEEFLNKYINNKKIFVILPGSTKVEKQLLEYNNTEVFTNDDLLVNIIDNNLVPKHIVLSDKEANDILTEYQINKDNLSRIFTNDRIAKYYNMKPGQIVKIIRPSITAGNEIIYRICVNGKVG
jgi:DNA-directed RNA polymerase subunit H (RpoH/RPB5)